MSDLITRTRERLGLNEGPDRTPVTRDSAMRVLRELARDVQHGQRAIGMVLWHLDPVPADLARIAGELELETETLRSWMTTYSRLRHDANLAAVAFSMQRQLARIQDPARRMEIWNSRPADEWTLAALQAAADAYAEEGGVQRMPMTKKAGCKAKFGDDRQVKANLELKQDRVIVTLTVSDGAKLEGMKFEEVSAGEYAIKFDW